MTWTDTANALALGLASLGLLGAGIAVIRLGIQASRERDVDAETVPWGYIGVGLILTALPAAAISHVMGRDLPAGFDVRDLVLLGAVCAWGFAHLQAWAVARRSARLPWTLPLLLSLLLGCSLGLT